MGKCFLNCHGREWLIAWTFIINRPCMNSYRWHGCSSMYQQHGSLWSSCSPGQWAEWVLTREWWYTGPREGPIARPEQGQNKITVDFFHTALLFGIYCNKGVTSYVYIVSGINNAFVYIQLLKFSVNINQNIESSISKLFHNVFYYLIYVYLSNII